MRYIDKTTRFFIADPSVNPFEQSVTHQELLEAYRTFIVSSSGWRKVFAASGNEEDAGENVNPADLYMTALAAIAISRTLGTAKEVLIGLDARPTGPALADAAIRTFLASGLRVRYIFIASAPEIMADSALYPCDAFFYISASHNPIGHNGFKIGRDGGVLSATEVADIISTFQDLVADPQSIQLVKSLAVDEGEYRKVLDSVEKNKQIALDRYTTLLRITATQSEKPKEIEHQLSLLKRQLLDHPVGIVGELNGSARCVSADKTFLASLGIETRFFNDTCRTIVHPIVPEGENLEQCRSLLEQAYKENPIFQLGYVPDNDGDRGNIVYITPSTGSAHILGAQDLFALVAAVELTLTRRTEKNLAIAVNGPTSLMIEHISKALQVHVARAEVGEANVVQLAGSLRDRGYVVRILGEGSNGGNITHPSKVRDPMNTLVSLLKLLSDRTLFDEIARFVGMGEGVPMDMEHALSMLPKRTITGSFSREAIMNINTTDHAVLKSAYESEFAKAWEERKNELSARFGIHGWIEQQTEHIACKVGVGPDFRSAKAKGGLKILFLDAHKQPTDFIWMRGSQTEPVFRILVDALGTDQERHDYLLAWQRALVTAADDRASSQ